MDKLEKKLVIGILGMPDNESTTKLVEYFSLNNITIDFVVYWKPSMKDQYKRTMRKLRASGIIPTAKRIYYALGKKNTENKKKCKKDFDQYFVYNQNSSECQKILQGKKVDILILAIDAIVTRNVLEIPRLATLNAHPGWIPQFRGLGSVSYQLEKGWFPAVSVHKVDEGIDTGPLIVREYIEVDPKDGLDVIEDKVSVLQRALFLKTIEMFKADNVKYIDTFGEPSNMTRGMSLKQKKELDIKLKSGDFTLNAPSIVLAE